MSEVYKTSLKTGWQILLYSCAALVAVLSLDLVMGALFQLNFIIDNIKQDVETWIIAFFGFIFIASLISMLYTYVYEVKIEGNTLIKKGLFRSYSFTVDEIDKIFVDIMIVNFKSGNKTVSLGNLYSEFEAPVEHISKQIEGRTDIHFKGRDKNIKKYFPWAVDE